MKTSVLVSILFISLLSSAPASAGLLKWINKEAMPTLKGERKLEIKPYISVKSDGKFEYRQGPNDFKIKVGGITIQTHQLRLRLAQAGCTVATGGDVLTCAPDIIERELLNIADGIDPANPASISPSALAKYEVPVVAAPQYSFAPGTAMQPCGCWGYNPQPVAYEPRCERSRVVVAQCPGWCQQGGVPYGYMCM